MDDTPKVKKLTGFASMTPEAHRAIARKGQAALAAQGKRHAWTSEAASAASKLGWARRKAAK